MTSVTLPGLHLAPAWLNTALATGDDESRPILYQTTLVEIFPTGIQLIATDSFMLLGAYIPTTTNDLTPAPSTDTEPDEAYIVMDPDKRMQALMKFVHKDAKAADKDGLTCDVTLSVQSYESADTPTLDPSLDRAAFTVTAGNERLTLPIHEGTYANWRHLLADHTAKSTKRILLNPQLLGRFGKLIGVTAPLTLDLAGPKGLIGLSAHGDESYLFGGVMPVVA